MFDYCFKIGKVLSFLAWCKSSIMWLLIKVVENVLLLTDTC